MAGFKRNQLRSFVTVAEEGQITRAASKLHIAQPALSQAIAQLERELGLQLLERHARGVTLTPAGEVFFEKARAAVAATDEALGAATTLAHSAGAALQIGFLGTSPTVHVPQLLAAFSESHPECALSFRELGFPSGTLEAWIEGVDVALCFPANSESAVDVLVLRAEPRYLLTRSDHALAQRAEVAVADVLDETFVGYGSAQGPGWADSWSLDDHRGRPPASITADGASTPMELVAAISSQDAVTALPTCHAETIVRAAPGLVAIPIADARPLELSLVWRRTNPSPAVRALCSVARRLAADSDPPS